MLVLMRKIDEVIVIGDEIRVMVVGVKAADGTTLHGCKVRLGVMAPRSLSVHRKEIYDEILAERKRAIDSPEAMARREAENRIDPDFGKDHA